MIGDSDNDVKAGEMAGCSCIKIGNKESEKNLLSAVNIIIRE
jgi:hypothetical protein